MGFLKISEDFNLEISDRKLKETHWSIFVEKSKTFTYVH